MPAGEWPSENKEGKECWPWAEEKRLSKVGDCIESNEEMRPFCRVLRSREKIFFLAFDPVAGWPASALGKGIAEEKLFRKLLFISAEGRNRAAFLFEAFVRFGKSVTGGGIGERRRGADSQD